ncbi:MAG: SUMF1/EgtB/PvdO family nonheme iron enzyme [Candidatus Competibacteraceae bacterium]|nr:SUMF1/EgtB/PvdO family nonheme iron enzyme [Candidatus Competibacteraceae bacterium]
MSPYDGKTKLAFCDRLGDQWKKLADYFDVAISERDRFQQGDEPRAVWEWLERRKRLTELPDALRYIDREDIVVEVLEPPPPPAASLSRPDWSGSPYPGLRHFSDKEHAIFFGRDEEIRELLKRLADPLQRFIAVVGTSGSGKSSLVMAGVIRRLPAGWVPVRFTPGGLGDDPFLALAAKLESSLEPHSLTGRAIAERLRARGDLDALARLILEQRWPADELLLFVDQFEELFTLVADEHRRRFVALLTKAAESPRVRAILTVRADFYPQCIDIGLESLLRAGSYPLAAPKLRALLEMITGPAALVGLRFEDRLPGRLLEDTGREPGVLALLAFALAELYRRKDGMLLTHAAYDDFGRVPGAISQRAEAIFTALDAEAQTAFEVVFRELVKVDEQGVATRQRAWLDPLRGLAAVQRFIAAYSHQDARLLVCAEAEQRPTVEVAHEALLSYWPRLKQWIAVRRDDLWLRRQIAQLAAYWRDHDRKDEHRWPDARVAEVIAMREHLKLEPTDFTPLERDFLGPLDCDQMLAALDEPATTHEQRAIIGVRLALLGDPRPGVGLRADGLPDIVWCPVPGGEVMLEENTGTFTVEPFQIAKYPVTYRQYRAFLDAEDGYHNAKWWSIWVLRPFDKPGRQFQRYDNHPAENLTWVEAVPFCRWLSAKLGYEVRLPTEWEWQQAATGGDPANEYPWGPDWDAQCANTYESELSRSTAVGMYPQGASPVGALDMSGNVWEFCLNEYDQPRNVGPAGKARQVVRGGAWDDLQAFARAACRGGFAPAVRNLNLGFRLARASPI